MNPSSLLYCRNHGKEDTVRIYDFGLFEPIIDTREQGKVLHELMECLFIYVAATLNGMDTLFFTRVA